MKRDCRVFRHLTAFVDNELPERMRRKVEEHLGRCETCSRELDSIRASDRILASARPPALHEERWSEFRVGLSQALDEVDRETRRSARLREVRPLHGAFRRRVLATVGACAGIVLVVLSLGPMGLLSRSNGNGDDCIVDSIETYAAGYTPMFFTSEDPEMTVIWVFAEEVEGGATGEALGAQ